MDTNQDFNIDNLEESLQGDVDQMLMAYETGWIAGLEPTTISTYISAFYILCNNLVYRIVYRSLWLIG